MALLATKCVLASTFRLLKVPLGADKSDDKSEDRVYTLRLLVSSCCLLGRDRMHPGFNAPRV